MPQTPDQLIGEDSLLELRDYLQLVEELASEPRFRILYYLCQAESDNAQSIADALEMDPGTLRHHLKRLVDQELVHNRTRHSRDESGNYSYYAPTDLGERFTRYLTDLISKDQHQSGDEPVDSLRMNTADSGSGWNTVNNSTPPDKDASTTAESAGGDPTEDASTDTGDESIEFEYEALDELKRMLSRAINADGSAEDILEPAGVESAMADDNIDAIIESSIGFEESGDVSSLDDIDVRIIGCGGGGVRIVNRLHQIGQSNAQTITIDTDEGELNKGKADTRAVIGKRTLDGEGADGNLEAARGAVSRAEDAGVLNTVIGDPDLVFVLTGLGKGTGTALAPRVAETAHQTGAVVTTIATLPFSVESVQSRRAREALELLSGPSDTLAVLDGSYLDSSDNVVPTGKQLAKMNENVAHVVSNMTASIGRFQMNSEDNSLLSMLEDGGNAVLLGAELGLEESYDALSDRLLQYSNVDIGSEMVAQAILVISAGAEVTGDDIDEIISSVNSHVESLAWTARNHAFSDPDSIRVTGILTGVDVTIKDILPASEPVADSPTDCEEAEVATKEDVEILPSNTGEVSPPA